jgi:uncharacterized repeat protein (TIGR04076 family)
MENQRSDEMEKEIRLGYRVVGTITSVKGHCNAGHKAGDRIELSGHSSGGLCGFLYHDIFPYVIMLQFGGGFPADWGDPDVIHMECLDKFNLVKIELKRVRDE